MAWPRITNAQETAKPCCPIDKTCLKKSTRDSCIRCFADVKKLKRDHKINLETEQAKAKTRLEGCKQKNINMEGRLSTLTDTLQKGCEKDKRAALITGILWGAGSVVVIAGVATLAVVIYYFVNSWAASAKTMTYNPIYQGVFP